MKKKLIAGISVTIFLVTMITVALPARVSAQFPGGTIKIGIVGPKGWIQWDGLWEAAQIARDMINKEGAFATWPGQKGINTPGGLAKIELVDIDEHSVPGPDPAAGIAELLTKVEANPTMYHIFGGFRTECVAPMEEALMDYAAVHKRPIWTIAGAATDFLVSLIQTNYARYKYMFRVTPLNSTIMAMTFASFIKDVVAPKLSALDHEGDPTQPVPTYVIAENLVWCDSMVAFLKGELPGAPPPSYWGMDLKGVRRPSPVATDFSADIAAATGAGAKIVIHIFSAVAGANFIKQVGALKPSFACIGINVESQLQEFYASVGGACNYETFLASVGTQEGLTPDQSMNPNAKPLTTTEFWAIFKNLYGHSPIYTAWGSYDAIISLNETAYKKVGTTEYGWTVWWKQALAGVPGAVDKLILHMETLGLSDNPGDDWGRVQQGGRWYRNGMLGLFSYTGPRSILNPPGSGGGPDQGGYHDPFCTSYSLTPFHDGVIRAWLVQWQDGRMEVAYPRDCTFSRKWIVPTWMYPLETDFASENAAPYGFPVPDRTVDGSDMGHITANWFKTPPYTSLEADMKPYDYFIDIYDAARIGRDWGKP